MKEKKAVIFDVDGLLLCADCGAFYLDELFGKRAGEDPPAQPIFGEGTT